MATVIDINNARLTDGEHWTERAVLEKVAASMRRWVKELPEGSGWYDSLSESARVLEDAAAREKAEFEAILAKSRGKRAEELELGGPVLPDAS
jgi:hypothetical protein